MKKKLALLLVLALCLGLAPLASADSSPFDDVPSDYWAYNEIMEAYNDRVMTGTAPGVFDPASKLNMAQFTTVLTRAFYASSVSNWESLGLPWPEPNISAGEVNGLFSCIKNYQQNPEVTREVMAQMMYNVMVDKGAALPSNTAVQAAMDKIPDITAVSTEYKTAVAVCYYLDLLSGVDANGMFAPNGILNRAQTAVIYTRLKKAVSGGNLGGDEVPTTIIPDPTQEPETTATLTNGMPVTEENVLALIEEYRNGKEPGEKAKAAGFTSYADGAKYDAYEPKYYLAPFGNGKECAKFAFAFWDDIFGADAPMRKTTDYTSVRPGDLIQFSGHWCIATGAAFEEEYSQGTYYVAPNVGGGSAGQIGWGDGENLADIVAIYTRYPE